MATASDSYAKDYDADIPEKEVDNEISAPNTGIVKDWDEEEGPLRRKYVQLKPYGVLRTIGKNSY